MHIPVPYTDDNPMSCSEGGYTSDKHLIIYDNSQSSFFDQKWRLVLVALGPSMLYVALFCFVDKKRWYYLVIVRLENSFF